MNGMPPTIAPSSQQWNESKVRWSCARQIAISPSADYYDCVYKKSIIRICFPLKAAAPSRKEDGKLLAGWMMEANAISRRSTAMLSIRIHPTIHRTDGAPLCLSHRGRIHAIFVSSSTSRPIYIHTRPSNHHKFNSDTVSIARSSCPAQRT